MTDVVDVRDVISRVFDRPGTRRERDREMPLGPKAQRTRAAIVDAAREVLGRQGYLATSTADIAAAAGVSLGTVYQYFRDRSDLVAELVHQQVATMLRRTDTTWRIREGPDGLRRVLTNFVAAYVATTPMMAVWEEVAQVEPELADLRRELGRLFTAAVAAELDAAVTGGTVAADLDPTLTACALTAMVDRYCYVTYVFDPPRAQPSVEVSADLLTRLWWGAIGLA